MQSYRRHGVQLALLALLLSSAGCGHMRQAITDRLAAKYELQFACDSAEVLWPEWIVGPAEFRVEGCGEVAFYNCDKTCFLEHHRPMTDAERTAAAARKSAGQEKATAQPSVVQEEPEAETEFSPARALIVEQPAKAQPVGDVAGDDWRLGFSRLPENVPFVLVRFSAQRPLSASPCRPTITRDGEVLTTETIRSHSAHEADFLIRASDFQRFATSQSIRGVVCGVDISFDEAARKQLATVVTSASR